MLTSPLRTGENLVTKFYRKGAHLRIYNTPFHRIFKYSIQASEMLSESTHFAGHWVCLIRVQEQLLDRDSTLMFEYSDRTLHLAPLAEYYLPLLHSQNQNQNQNQTCSTDYPLYSIIWIQSHIPQTAQPMREEDRYLVGQTNKRLHEYSEWSSWWEEMGQTLHPHPIVPVTLSGLYSFSPSLSESDLALLRKKVEEGLLV